MRTRRLKKVLRRVATAFYLQNFNLRQAFLIFDQDGDGTISRREFHEGWNSLGLGLTTYEIDALFAIVKQDKGGEINYEEFIAKMDITG